MQAVFCTRGPRPGVVIFGLAGGVQIRGIDFCTYPKGGYLPGVVPGACRISLLSFLLSELANLPLYLIKANQTRTKKAPP